MRQPDWQSEDGTIRLYHGDCLELLPMMAGEGLDALICDPPYSSGGQFRGDRNQKTSTKYIQTDSELTCRTEFSGDNRDQRAFLAWAGLWFGYALRACRPGAIACVFTDWRQLPTMTDAIQCGGWVWRNLVTWWKPGIRMQRGRFSSSAEYVVYASSGVPSDGETSPQNVLAFPPVPGDDKVHIAEKPVELIETLVRVSVPLATVLDPFMGSGSTAAACIKSGRRFVGCELDRHAFDSAVERIERELAQPKLPFAERPVEVQEAMFA